MFRGARWMALLGVMGLVSLAGCDEEPAITSYETPRTGDRAVAFDAEMVRRGLDHMLVAVVPDGEQAWFFKLVVRGDDLDGIRKSFDEFVKSVRVGGEREKPEWTLPKGWTEQAGGPMRAATIVVPHAGSKVELTVSSLPLGEKKWSRFIAENVDRWMGQLQQAPLSEKTIAKISRSVPLEGGKATVLELVGVMEAAGGAMPAGHPPVAGAKPKAAATAPVEKETAGAPRAQADAASKAGFEYEAPEGWAPGQMSMMRRAAFVVAEEGRQAEVTVMPFPASGPMGDPIAQAKRWAGQVGLGAVTDDELKQQQKSVTIDGVEGQLFELMGPGDADGPKGTLAAMVQRGDQMWFFKMFGDRPLVESQRDEFDAFLKSVDFPEDSK